MRRTRLSLPSIPAARTPALSSLCRLSPLSIAMACLLRAPSVLAAGDNLTPAGGQTTTCDTNAPNPSPIPVVAAIGSTGVTVIVQPGAGLSVLTGNGILVRDDSAVLNLGTLQVGADSFSGIVAAGSVGGLGAIR